VSLRRFLRIAVPEVRELHRIEAAPFALPSQISVHRLHRRSRCKQSGKPNANFLDAKRTVRSTASICLRCLASTTGRPISRGPRHRRFIARHWPLFDNVPVLHSFSLSLSFRSYWYNLMRSLDASDTSRAIFATMLSCKMRTFIARKRVARQIFL